MLLEAQEHLKSRLAQSLGVSFANSALMTKWNADSNGLTQELHTSSRGGCLAAFLTPAPARASTIIPPASGSVPAPSLSPASSGSLVRIGAERSLSPPETRHAASTTVSTNSNQDAPSAVASTPVASTPFTTATPSTPTTAPGSSPFTPIAIPSRAVQADQSTSSGLAQSPPQANPASPRPFINTSPGPSQATTGDSTSPLRATSPPLSPNSFAFSSPFTSIPPSDLASQPSSSGAQLSTQPRAVSPNAATSSSATPSSNAATPSSSAQTNSTTTSASPPTLASLATYAGPNGPHGHNMPSLHLSAMPHPALGTGAVSQSAPNLYPTPALVSPHTVQVSTLTASGSIPPLNTAGANQLNASQPLSARAKMASMSERRASRGSLVDETITSSRVNKTLSGSSPAPLKPTASPARVNVIQLVGVVRDKVGLAKRDKERKEREKYFDPVTNGWMFMEAPNLDDLIYDPNMMIIFYEFLKTIHAEENLVGWVEIELYKCSNAGRETRRNLGVDLLVRYFEPTSKSLINIEGVNYKEILKELNAVPARDLFDGAARVLWDQLAFQCYLRFKESDSVRRLFEEPTLKGKKKELLKLAQKAMKSNSDNANFFNKLDELSRWRAGSVASIPNVSDREFQLEDILYSSDLLVAFREYLNTLPNSTEFLDALAFWFEVEVWKVLVPRENLRDAALQIYRDFIAPPSTGGPARIIMPAYDVKALEQDLQDRPDKNAFTRLQVYTWRRLKLEQFSLFEGSDTLTKFLDGNLPMRQNLPIVRHCENLNENRAKVANDAQFKANYAKVFAKIRHKRQEVQGTNFELEVLLADKEYVAILCEFLDKRQARENLNFWAEAEYYKYMHANHERVTVANRIWDRFFSDKAEIHINVDVTEKSALQQALKEPRELGPDLFNNCQDTIATLITFDLLPKFCVSEQGQRLTKAAKRRAPNPNAASAFRAGGVQAVKDLRVWLGIED